MQNIWEKKSIWRIKDKVIQLYQNGYLKKGNNLIKSFEKSI